RPILPRRRGVRTDLRYLGCAVGPVVPCGAGSTLGLPVPCGVGRTVGTPVPCGVGSPLGLPEPCGAGSPEGRPVPCGAGDGCGTRDGDVPGGAAVAQYAVTLPAPPAAAASLSNAAARCLRLPCALACAQAVHKP